MDIILNSNALNIEASLLTNFLGVLISIIMLSSRSWKFISNKKERAYFIIMICAILSSCFADSLSFCIDGRPGKIARFFVYASNMWLFMSNVAVSFCWLHVLLNHLDISLHKVHRRILESALTIGALMLIVNIFVPIVFYVDNNNVYQRRSMFVFFLIVDIGIVIDSLFAYFKVKKTSGGLKFFPVWVFVIPSFLGIVIQSLVYGVSLLGPCTAISIAGLLISLQSEMIFKDKLTGLNNRYYMDYIKEMISKSRQSIYTIMMLDLNGFKSINDKYGHDEGDHALLSMGTILTNAVQNDGTVIRYAGDEFIVVLNTQDDAIIQGKAELIKNLFDEYNSTHPVPYELSAAIGYCKVDLKQMNVDEVMNIVDKRMYEAKAEYYSAKETNRRTLSEV